MVNVNTRADSLYTYLKNSGVYSRLKTELSQIENRLNRLDEQIDQFEKFGFDPLVEFLVEDRNKLDLLRIQTNLKLIEVKKEMLVFEYDVATRE